MTEIKRITSKPQPTALTLHNLSRTLEVTFDDGAQFLLPFELLRVYSPSAEVSGHGPGQEVLQVGKREVGMAALDPVGNYAVQPTFSDGHNTGYYTWDFLYQLGVNQEAMWADYMARLHAAGFVGDSGREASSKISAPKAAVSGCGHQH